MKTVILIGTLDTKGVEYQFAKERFKKSGLNTILIDAGIIGESVVKADISNEEVARAGGEALATLKNLGDRGFAVSVMKQGVNQIVQDLFK